MLHFTDWAGYKQLHTCTQTQTHTTHTHTHNVTSIIYKCKVVELKKKQGEQVQGRVRGRKAKSGQLYLLSQKYM